MAPQNRESNYHLTSSIVLTNVFMNVHECTDQLFLICLYKLLETFRPPESQEVH